MGTAEFALLALRNRLRPGDGDSLAVVGPHEVMILLLLHRQINEANGVEGDRPGNAVTRKEDR